MGNKLKNMRTNRQKKTNDANNNYGNEILIDNEEQCFHDDAICKADMEFLKSTVVCEENLNEIKEKLQRTMHYRHKMMKNPRIDVLESFPFFLTSPELVSSVLNILNLMKQL